MFIDIANFRNIMADNRLWLPKRWAGIDFLDTLKNHFDDYKVIIKPNITNTDFQKIILICRRILSTIDEYQKGNIVKAYHKFDLVMESLFSSLQVYEKSGYYNETLYRDTLKLYRVRNVADNKIYKREDIFHIPYNMRSKVPTCRYSIAGYPSLYLSTQLALCCEEVLPSKLNDMKIASRFKIVRNQAENTYRIKVIELAIKPQNFLNIELMQNKADYSSNMFFLDNGNIRENYLLWYPLVSSCSYIRVNKSDPFAVEYIIPQLLMQWVRKKSTKNELFGIRYFSCQSIKASNMGVNYVFPVSGDHYDGSQFCSVLVNSFKLTNPEYIHEYETIGLCQSSLDHLSEDFINI